MRLFLVCGLILSLASTANADFIAGRDLALAELDPSYNSPVNGVWSYGYRTNGSLIDPAGVDPFVAFAASQHTESYQASIREPDPTLAGFADSSFYPAVTVNTGTANETIGGALNRGINGVMGDIGIRPGDMFLHPGLFSSVVVRFTAPTAGLYSVSASWFDAEAGGGNGVTVGAVLNNLANILGVPTGQIVAEGGSFSGTTLVSLLAGDTIDFTLANSGSNGNDSTGFNASIAAVPEPSSMALLGLCGLGMVGYRRFRGKKIVETTAA